ncbi:MAG: hypothetical protein WDO73_10735 [Ignavibacteriota bacterium]
MSIPAMWADAEELAPSLSRILALLDRNGIAHDTVTLVMDKGSAALANTAALQQAGIGWISALPWNQAPPELRDRPAEQLPALSGAHPGVRAAAEKLLVHGQEYLCVLKYSASFAGEQLHSVTTTVSKVLQSMRRLSIELAKPAARFTEGGIRRKIARWLAPDFISELIRYQLESHEGRWRLHFDFDHAAWLRLLSHRLGRTVLLSNRMDWDRRTDRRRLLRATTGRAGLPRFKGRRVAGLGTDASLDGHQNLRTCLLLHARHLASAIHP